MLSTHPLYNKEFFKHNKETARRSAERLVPFLYEPFKPLSVFDFGCSEGSFLDAFWELNPGIFTMGLDGPWSPKPDHPFIEWDVDGQNGMPPIQYAPKVTGTPGELSAPFDMALCLETAEHIKKKHSEALVQWLCNTAKIVVFGAAIPGQGGTGHINCKWQAEWGYLFQDCGYYPVDIVRPYFWEGDEIDWWYTQNTIIYAANGAELASRFGDSAFPLDTFGLPLNLIHPELWNEAIR